MKIKTNVDRTSTTSTTTDLPTPSSGVTHSDAKPPLAFITSSTTTPTETDAHKSIISDAYRETLIEKAASLLSLSTSLTADGTIPESLKTSLEEALPTSKTQAKSETSKPIPQKQISDLQKGFISPLKGKGNISVPENHPISYAFKAARYDKKIQMTSDTDIDLSRDLTPIETGDFIDGIECAPGNFITGGGSAKHWDQYNLTDKVDVMIVNNGTSGAIGIKIPLAETKGSA